MKILNFPVTNFQGFCPRIVSFSAIELCLKVSNNWEKIYANQQCFWHCRRQSFGSEGATWRFKWRRHSDDCKNVLLGAATATNWRRRWQLVLWKRDYVHFLNRTQIFTSYVPFGAFTNILNSSSTFFASRARSFMSSFHVHVVVILRDSGGLGAPPATGGSRRRLAKQFLSYKVLRKRPPKP